MKTRYTALGIALITWGPLEAQQVPLPEAPARGTDRPYVLATGQATVSTKPDQAIIDIGVITQGKTAVSVAAQNAKQTDAVLADLRKMLNASGQLRTTSYSVRPNYTRSGATATISGYTATNVVEVTLDDLSQVGKVIDAGIQSGANNIQRLQFGLKNPQAARSQALREAAVQAKANADAIAAGLGVRVLRVLSVEESGPGRGAPLQGLERTSFAANVAPPTEVEAGTVDVTATVNLRVEITQ